MNVEAFAALSDRQRDRFLSGLSEDQAAALRFDWEFWARLNQLPPSGDWRTWLVLAGRGFGKTRMVCEWARAQIEAGHGRGAMIARTSADARDVLVEGESGLLAVCPPWNRPTYEPSKRRVVWPYWCADHALLCRRARRPSRAAALVCRL